MQIGLALGQGLERQPLALPTRLENLGRRVRFIAEIDRPLLVDGQGVPQWTDMGQHLRDIATCSVGEMPEILDPLDRVSIALRLWAGCLMAAKTIALETRSGTNTEASRAAAFREIDAVAASDELFRAGVEAAPAFKASRNQPYCLDGVPAGSAVRHHQ